MARLAVFLCLTAVWTGHCCAESPERQRVSRPNAVPHVLVVGTGMAGLSAALEAAQGGARVTVLEMWSVYGGTSFISGGKVAIVGTALQERQGIHDAPDLAFQDFIHWGRDHDREWVRYYVDHSNDEIYQWLTAAGVRFDLVVPFPGNSVPRGHGSKELGVGLVSPLFRACVSHPNVRFVWNMKVVDLTNEGGRITGVRGVETRTGLPRSFPADAVILATGGFQSNLKMIRKFWPASLPRPERVLTGSGVNSLGIGHAIVRGIGAKFHRMSYVWNYPYGLPDPRDSSGKRGLMFAHGRAIWVNAKGRRFVNESAGITNTLPAMLRQTPACYWAVFDEANKRRVYVAGSDFGNFPVVERLIYRNTALVKSASSLASLAEAAGLPAKRFVETVRRYNAMIDAGEDADFRRFSAANGGRSLPPKIEKPPFYAVRLYALTRKNMGGVLTDHSCRVLDARNHPFPGLYAAGELSGFAGINGTTALEGTFLGPCVVTGRVAARAAIADAPPRAQHEPPPWEPEPQRSSPKPVMDARADSSCVPCHDVKGLVSSQRPGYVHFERSHRRVLDRGLDCLDCHGELTPYRPDAHRIDRFALSHRCGVCHLAED